MITSTHRVTPVRADKASGAFGPASYPVRVEAGVADRSTPSPRRLARKRRPWLVASDILVALVALGLVAAIADEPFRLSSPVEVSR